MEWGDWHLATDTKVTQIRGFITPNLRAVDKLLKQVVLEPRVSPEHTWKYVDTRVFFKLFPEGVKSKFLYPFMILNMHLKG